MYMESRMKNLLITLLFIVSTTISFAENDRGPKKRQIYREQVLPHAGGRIPDTAFETDRLFLNRLQKEGIAIPDGVVLEQRNPQVYPFLNRDHRKVFRVALSSDGRYVAKEGKTQSYNELPSIETTYLYPQIHDQKITLTPQQPIYPVYKQIQLYNSHLNQPKLQSKKKSQRLHNTSGIGNKGSLKSSKTTSYQNFNFIHDTTNHLHRSTTPRSNTNTIFSNPDRHYLPLSYENENLFREFNHYFNDFEFFGPNSNGAEAYNNEYTIDLPTSDSSSNSEQFFY